MDYLEFLLFIFDIYFNLCSWAYFTEVIIGDDHLMF